MIDFRRSTLVRLGLVLVLFVFVGTACSLSSGGDDDRDSDAQPTSPATITPPPTRTAFPTFTPFPTLTPGSGFQPIVPTATRIAFLPTATRFQTFPQQPTATSYPYDVRISYPVSGSQIAGYITVVGSASHPRFLQYALEWGPDPNPSNLWFALMPPRTQPVINGGLGSWNTTTLNDGNYQLRVHVWLTDGTETFALVTGLRVSNRVPTAVPTLTPTPRPNRPPQINPIPSQQVNAGSDITIPVTTSDPDGDTVNLFVSSSNEAIARGEVASTSQIAIDGVTAGAATITVTANDNNGGLTSTAFIVTVAGQNQAPTVSPILPQSVNVAQTVDVLMAVSDPDGDPLTASAASDNNDIVTASTVGTSAVRLTGVSVGSANVTLSVSDSRGATVKTTFQVTVGEPNRPPTINQIPAQTLSAGDTLIVNYTAVDPDGDALDHLASSDTTSVVIATVTTPGTIQLTAINPGPATVALTVDDSVNAPTIVTFPVTVVAGNVAPALDPIAPQTMSVDETRDVAYTVSDPEGDSLDEAVSSDNPGVVSASITSSGTVSLNGVAAGTATVTVTVNDGNNPDVSQSFTVSVAAVNLPPALETIFPQMLNVGETLDVGYAASDPEGDSLNESVVSDNAGVVTAAISNSGTITLNGAGAGTTTVTVTVDDGNNAPVSMPFTVTVNETNDPPSINAISPQTMNVGNVLDVPYTASDPDGDQLTATATSDNPGVVGVGVNVAGTVTLQAFSGGTANVTLSVTDNVNAPVTVTFAVTVNAPNNAPSLDPIGSQTMNVGDVLDVPYTASDPDGDQLTATATSDNPGVVGAGVNVAGAVTLQAFNGGTANVTLSVTDNVNAPVMVTFAVTVNAPNNAPQIQPIGDQALNVGEQINVTVSVSDPDGDPVALVAFPQNPGVVDAQAFGTDTVQLTGVAEGVTTVDVTADDAKGGVSTVTFTVTVSSAPGGFDLNAYPVVPDISEPMAQSLRQLFESGKSNFGNRAGVFVRVGDQTMDGPHFMAPFAGDDYNLGNNGPLQATIDFFSGTAVRTGDPAANSFNVDSIAAGPDYGIDTLSSQAGNEAACVEVGGGTLLSCELQLSRPSIALVSFSAANVTYLPPEQFRAELQTLVTDMLSNYGVIPVLATIPSGNGYSDAQVMEYNQVIVEVASQSGITGVPLWNLWRAMNERGISDPQSVAPQGAGFLAEGGLSYGYNVRNLTALQTLEKVRQAVGIN